MIAESTVHEMSGSIAATTVKLAIDRFLQPGFAAEQRTARALRAQIGNAFRDCNHRPARESDRRKDRGVTTRSVERRERDNLKREREKNRRGAEAADPAIAQNLQRTIAIAARAESIRRVGESVQMQRAGDDRQREHDQDRANRQVEKSCEKKILERKNDRDREPDKREPSKGRRDRFIVDPVAWKNRNDRQKARRYAQLCDHAPHRRVERSGVWRGAHRDYGSLPETPADSNVAIE